MLTQLDPTIPVSITSKANAVGEAFALWVRSPEHHVYWGVILDVDGRVYWTPNHEIRVTPCWTVERPPR